jgi:hypothetical protein
VIAAILHATWKAFRRGQSEVIPGTPNLFFPTTLYFLRQAGIFVYLIAGLVLLFPLSSDPMRKIPPDRLVLWPLTRRQRRTLRLLTPWLNPVLWAMAALVVWGIGRSVSVGLTGALLGLAAAGFLLPSLPLPDSVRISALVPALPGVFGMLLRMNLRQLLTLLEFWMSLVLSLAAVVYRFYKPSLPAEAAQMIAMLIVLAFASYAASLFGLDGDGGMTRYRLLPLRGWQILLGKGVALLLVVMLLTLPLAPVPAIVATLITLSVGHRESVVGERRQQHRWRFTTGTSIGFGITQVAAIAVAVAGTRYSAPAALGAAGVIYAISLWWSGRRLDQLGSA